MTKAYGNLEEVTLDLLKSLECPYDTDGTLESRQASMIRVQACLRLGKAMNASTDLIEGVVSQIESESVDQGVRTVRSYAKGIHNTIVGSMNLHSKLIYKMMTDQGSKKKKKRRR